MSKTWKIVIAAIIITAVVVGGGFYLWQRNKVNQLNIKKGDAMSIEPNEPLSFSLKGISVTDTRRTVAFDYTAKQLKGMADECGSQHDIGYFDKLISKFSGTTKIVYNFKFNMASQEPDTFVVTLLPNKAGYTSLDQFKKDFDICAAGGDAYPTMLNSNWLLFVNSCGSGFNDGSGRPIGCDEVQKVVEPTLKLN